MCKAGAKGWSPRDSGTSVLKSRCVGGHLNRNRAVRAGVSTPKNGTLGACRLAIVADSPPLAIARRILIRRTTSARRLSDWRDIPGLVLGNVQISGWTGIAHRSRYRESTDLSHIVGLKLSCCEVDFFRDAEGNAFEDVCELTLTDIDDLLKDCSTGTWVKTENVCDHVLHILNQVPLDGLLYQSWQSGWLRQLCTLDASGDPRVHTW